MSRGEYCAKHDAYFGPLAPCVLCQPGQRRKPHYRDLTALIDATSTPPAPPSEAMTREGDCARGTLLNIADGLDECARVPKSVAIARLHSYANDLRALSRSPAQTAGAAPRSYTAEVGENVAAVAKGTKTLAEILELCEPNSLMDDEERVDRIERIARDALYGTPSPNEQRTEESGR